MRQLVEIQKFFSHSKILRKQHITVDFLIEVLPYVHGLSRPELIYQHSETMLHARRDFKRYEGLLAQQSKTNRKAGAEQQGLSMVALQADAP